MNKKIQIAFPPAPEQVILVKYTLSQNTGAVQSRGTAT